MNAQVNQEDSGPRVGPGGQIEDELGKYIKRVAPPKFNIKAIRVGVDAWITEMEKYFGLYNLSYQTKVAWATY